MNTRNDIRTIAWLGALLLLCAISPAKAQTTAFTYQGQLDTGGLPANGTFDLEFSLYDSAGASNLVAGPLTNSIGVTNGIFTVQLDFGASAFSGPARWLAVGVKTNGSSGFFSLLLPLQQITAAPYAITANSASNLLGQLPASQITGAISASQFPSTLISNSQAGVTLSGTFSGDGTGLSVSASNLTGAVSLAQIPGGVVTNGETGVTLSGTLGGTFPASGLTGAISAGQLPATVVVNGQSGVNLSGTFSGNGAGLSGVSASSFNGTLSLGQLPASVLVNGASSVTLSGSFNGFFSGNGSGLTSINAGALTGTLPAGVVGPVNAANLQGTVPASALSGSYPNVLVLNNQGNTIAGDGSGLTNLTATALTGIVPLTNLPGNVFSIFTNVLTVVTNLSVVGTQTVATLEVTNSLLLTNSPLLATNTDGQYVSIVDGNIVLTGVLSGNASGLTNATGHPLADTSVTNTLSGLLLTTGNTLTNFATNFAYTVGQAVGLNASNFAQGIGASLSNYAQGASPVLSNYVLAGGTLPKDALITNAMLVGPSTNAGGFWVTNGTLFVTNQGLGTGVTIRALDGSVAASNVTVSGVFTGNGSGLTEGSGSPFGTTLSNFALTIGSSTTNFATNFANAIGQNATNFGYGVIAVNATNTALAVGANDTNFALLIGANGTNFTTNFAEVMGIALTNFASNIGLNDTNFTKSVGVTISNYAQAGNAILSNYVAAGGTLPRSSLITNALLVGSTTNEGPFWVTNGSVVVSNGAVVLTNAGGIGVALNNGNTGNITFTGVASGDGAGLTQVNAAMLEGLTTNNFWLNDGNSGTTPAGNFLGTIDQQPLLVKVDLQSALEVFPDTTGNLLPVIIGDPAANTVNPNAYGSIIAAGTGNSVASGSYLTVITGGNANTVGTAAFNSVISGGNGNVIQTGSYESVIGGGLQNLIQNASSNSFVGGGSLNTIQANTGFGTIGGGYNNQIETGAGYSTIGGGYLNAILPNAGYSAIAGGQGNFIQTGSAQSFVGGGNGNTVAGSAPLSVIGGGAANLVGTSSDHSAIVGGQNNQIGQTIPSDHAFIGGGNNNSVTGPDGAVVGGSGNIAGAGAFAAGTSAHANDAGSFVWADSTGGTIASTNQDTVTFRAQNGYRLYTTSGQTAGAFLAGGATAWATISDRNVKKNIVPVDPLAVLEKLAQVPVATWNYKWEGDNSVPNIGPMAQDFKKAFYPGRDDKSITTLEFDGVELAAIKGLNTKVEERDANVQKEISAQAEQIKSKDAEIQALKDRLDRLEKMLNVDKQ